MKADNRLIAVLGAPFRWSRRLYDWVLGLGNSPHSQSALFALSAAEASFFPVPPDALLIALCMGSPRRWARFATVCSIGSVIGGMIGYLIGYAAFDLIGHRILTLIASLSGSDSEHLLEAARYWFNEREIWGMKVGAWAVGVAGFTPVPYKVFTIAAGFFKMSFAIFVISSAISRSARFFAVAGLIGLLFERHGDRIKQLIDRYFNLLAVAFVLLLVAGFFVLSYID